jgi:hypothetical protein
MQVVELGQENQRLRLAAEQVWAQQRCQRGPYEAMMIANALLLCQAATTAEDKVKQVQRCNKEAMKENCT